MDRGAWQNIAAGVTKSKARLSAQTHTHACIYIVGQGELWGGGKT